MNFFIEEALNFLIVKYHHLNQKVDRIMKTSAELVTVLSDATTHLVAIEAGVLRLQAQIAAIGVGNPVTQALSDAADALAAKAATVDTETNPVVPAPAATPAAPAA